MPTHANARGGKRDRAFSTLTSIAHFFLLLLCSLRSVQAISEFAQALLVIPKTLAVNAAQDATELVAKLCAYHHAAQSSPEKADQRFMGLDLVRGKVVHNLKAGVVEPAISKVKSLKFATEAAITILRIDDFIKISPPQQRQGGR